MGRGPLACSKPWVLFFCFCLEGFGGGGGGGVCVKLNIRSLGSVLQYFKILSALLFPKLFIMPDRRCEFAKH